MAIAIAIAMATGNGDGKNYDEKKSMILRTRLTVSSVRSIRAS